MLRQGSSIREAGQRVDTRPELELGFQRALYRIPVPSGAGGHAVLPPVSVAWLSAVVGAVAAGSILLMLLAWRTFFHMSGDFAEEL